jgi:hypothetical protein
MPLIRKNAYNSAVISPTSENHANPQTLNEYGR